MKNPRTNHNLTPRPRKAVEDIANEFQFIPYHAGMSDEDRTKAQNSFMNDACPVLVATNRFRHGN